MIFPFFFLSFFLFPFFFLFKLKTGRRLREFSLGSSIDFPPRHINEVNYYRNKIGELLPNRFKYMFPGGRERRNRSYLLFMIADGNKGLPRKKISLAKKQATFINS